MKIKVNAASRLNAGWWEDLSGIAKKAYNRLHPNSKMGDGGSSGADKGAQRSQAEEEHKQNMKNYDKHRDSMHDGSTDAEWDAHDRALQKLEKSRDRLKKLR